MRTRSAAAAPAAGVGTELLQLIEQIGREKNIEVEVLIGALEDAITTASRKAQERGPTRAAGQETLISRLDRQSGAIQVMARKRVTEDITDSATEVSLAEALEVDREAQLGSYVDLPRSTKGLGRIEAQAAKQVISQKVREAEREIVYSEFAPRVGDLVNAVVKRFERGDIVLDLGRIEALLPRRFQSRAELFAAGDRVRALVVEVSKLAKGPQVVVSRIDPFLLVRLFELEVPEIHEGTVILKQVVREAGERAKVAVSSRQRDIDPVGACVGMKGARVQAIIRELRGEKIDIVPWAEELQAFAAQALNPAKVARVLRLPGPERGLEALVEGAQLSLAIGKKGQNVRLASRLVGCAIDIRSDDEHRRRAEAELEQLTRGAAPVVDLPEVGQTEFGRQVAAAGLATVAELLAADDARLADAGVTMQQARLLRDSARAWLDRVEQSPESRERDTVPTTTPDQPDVRA